MKPISTPRIHSLPNGVRLVCDPIPGLQTLALTIAVGRGARWEMPQQSGWAHLLEHMVFKGAGERSARDIVEQIEAAGGSINAATGHERTSFQVRALKGGLPLGMAVLADLIQRPTLTADDLAKEKPVIAQEIAEAADTPDDQVFELAQAQAFAGHALGRPILGTRKSVNAATAARLADYRAALYAPDAIVISAAGAVDEGELLALAESAFSEPRASAPLDAPTEAAFAGGQARAARALEQAHLVLLLPAPGLRDPDYFALRLFAEILGGGMSSRLFQEVREHRGLAYAVDAYADGYHDVGVLGIYAGTAPENAEAAARLAAEQVLALIERADDAELARAKAQFKAATFMAAESTMARAEQAAGQLLTFGRLYSIDETAETIDAVTTGDLKRLGARLLAPASAAGAVLGPKRALAAGEAFHAALLG
jgi:predicted Zn-dependent peptidase